MPGQDVNDNRDVSFAESQGLAAPGGVQAPLQRPRADHEGRLVCAPRRVEAARPREAVLQDIPKALTLRVYFALAAMARGATTARDGQHPRDADVLALDNSRTRRSRAVDAGRDREWTIDKYGLERPLAVQDPEQPVIGKQVPKRANLFIYSDQFQPGRFTVCGGASTGPQDHQRSLAGVWSGQMDSGAGCLDHDAPPDGLRNR